MVVLVNLLLREWLRQTNFLSLPNSAGEADRAAGSGDEAGG